MIPDWLTYANQGATRNMPLSNDLVTALSFLPELGLTAEVFSGGQPTIGTSPNRVGSTRHDGGGAADLFFYQNGQRLDWANPAHVPIFQEVVRRGRQAGLTGFGAGPGYMQPGSMHIGFGAPAVWGADGKGVNAPDWLREAFGAAPMGGSVAPRPNLGFGLGEMFAEGPADFNPAAATMQMVAAQQGRQRDRRDEEQERRVALLDMMRL